MQRKIFEGIRVLDFSQVISGSYATTMLGDLGAEVIKVEPPIIGDTLRFAGPVYKGESGFFLLNNRNKKSISVDLKKAEGVNLVKELIPHCDIITQNFKPGVMKKLGLAYEDVCKLKEDIIYASVSGYGFDNKYTDRPAYDNIIQGESGLASLNGSPIDGRPYRSPLSISDYTAGMYSAFAIASAIFHRQKTGQGQNIDIAMYDSLISIMDNAFLICDLLGDQFSNINNKEEKENTLEEMGLKNQGNRHPGAAPHSFYKTQDGFIAHMSLTNKMWHQLLEIIGRSDLVDDPKYNNLDKRKNLWREIDQIVEDWTSKHTTEEVISIFEQNKLPVGRIRNVDEVYRDSHNDQRGVFEEVNHPVAGKFKITNIPIKFSKTSSRIESPSPQLGQHNQEVLQGLLGYSSEKIEDLLGKKIVYQV